MGLDKNFVVRNGLEIASDLIFADSVSNKTGIGTTTPGSKLDVAGDANVSGNFKVTGVTTVGGSLDVGLGGTALRVDNGTQRVGVNTGSPDYSFEVIGDVGVSSHFNVGGISTAPILHVTGLTSSVHLNVTGVTTIADARINAGFSTVTYSEAQYLNVTGVGTAVLLNATDVNISGVATVGLVSATDIFVSGGSTFTGDVTLDSNLILGDNDKIQLGIGTDLEIYHDGSDSYIDETGTGFLRIRTSELRVEKPGTTETMFRAVSEGEVSLHYDNNAKLRTTSTGVDVTGLTDTDNLNVSGNTTIVGIATVGIITGATTIGVGTLFAAQIIGDGSLITGIDSSGNFQGKTVVCQNVFASTPGIGTFGSIVINNPAGRITATEFYGDGSNLTNTGSTLTAASGSQRVVLTSLTSGTMTSSTTDGDLTFDASTNTLSATNFSGDGSSLTSLNASNISSGTISDDRLPSSITSDITGNAATATRATDSDRVNVNATGSNVNYRMIFTEANDSTDTSGTIYKDSVANFYYNPSTNTLTAGTFSGTVSGGNISGGSIPNSALQNSTISGVSLGSNLATLTRGSYLTGSNYNGSTARTWSVDATTSNSANKIVARDGSGNFSAGTITATLSGTATNSTNTRVDTESSTNATRYITFADGGGSSNRRMKIDAGLTYNPSSDTLTVTNLSGNASTASNATNAGTLDGYNSSTSSTGNTVAVRDASGDIYQRYGFGSYFNMSHSSSSRTSDNVFYSSTDNYIRKNTASGMRSSLNVPTRTGGDASGTWGISISGNAASATTATSANSATSAASATSAVNCRVDHDNGNAWHRIVFISDLQSSGTDQRLYTDTSSTCGINPSTNQIRATTFVGSLSGNATSATTATTATSATSATTATSASSLNGNFASTSASVNTIAMRNSNGHLFANYFNTTANDVSSGVTKIMVETGNDNYIRHGNADAVKSFLGITDISTNPVYATYSASATPLVLSSTVQTINFANLEVSSGDFSSNSTGVTVQVAGYYLVSVSVQFETTSGTGQRNGRFYIGVNSATQIGHSNTFALLHSQNHPDTTASKTIVMDLNANDQVRVYALIATGSNINVTGYSTITFHRIAT